MNKITKIGKDCLVEIPIDEVSHLRNLLTRAALEIEFVYRGCQTENENIPSALSKLKEVQDYLTESIDIAEEVMSTAWEYNEEYINDCLEGQQNGRRI